MRDRKSGSSSSYFAFSPSIWAISQSRWCGGPYLCALPADSSFSVVITSFPFQFSIFSLPPLQFPLWTVVWLWCYFCASLIVSLTCHPFSPCFVRSSCRFCLQKDFFLPVNGVFLGTRIVCKVVVFMKVVFLCFVFSRAHMCSFWFRHARWFLLFSLFRLLFFLSCSVMPLFFSICLFTPRKLHFLWLFFFSHFFSLTSR